MVRQSGNTIINNKSWAQIVMGSGVQQKLQQNNLQSKKAQSKNQKKQNTQAQRNNTQQLKQVKQYLDKPKTTVKQISRQFISTTQYPRSISSAQLKALQQEYQGLCNLFNANNYYGKSSYSQSKAWIQTKGKNVISVASCYSLRHKPIQNVIRPQQKRAMKSGVKFIPKKNQKNNKSQKPKFGENKQSNWGAEKAWGKNQPKQIREPPKEQQKLKKQQQQMEMIQQRHRKQMELLQKAQLKQQELLLKKQTEQRKKLLQYQKQQKMRLQNNQAPAKVLRTNQKANVKQAKPLRHRLEAVRKQNQMVTGDSFKYTLNQLVDAMNYFPKKSYSSDRAWKYNKFLGGYFSTASYFAEKNAPFVPSSRPKVNVTNGLPVYTFSVKPTTKNVITPYKSNLQGIRTEGNGKYFENWNIGGIWTHYYSKPKARVLK